MLKVPEISVFFPAFNEENNIKETVLEAVTTLKAIADKWEIIVIDDGSSDNTTEIVLKLSKENNNIKLIKHQRNKGYGAAIKTGLAVSKYKYICQMDSDGQFTFSEIKRFIKEIPNADLVIGFRKKRTDSFYRHILAKILWLADLILFQINVKDIDCGFKLFKKKVVDSVGKLETESAITVTEFLVRAKKKGFKIIEIGIDHHSRISGEQTGGKIKVVFKAAMEGLKLWWLFLKNE